MLFLYTREVVVIFLFIVENPWLKRREFLFNNYFVSCDTNRKSVLGSVLIENRVLNRVLKLQFSAGKGH